MLIGLDRPALAFPISRYCELDVSQLGREATGLRRGRAQPAKQVSGVVPPSALNSEFGQTELPYSAPARSDPLARLLSALLPLYARILACPNRRCE